MAAGNDADMEGAPPRRLLVKDLNPHLLCTLCDGYYVDATCINQCMHTFCRSCIVRYLESSKYCPTCDILVHKSKPLSALRPDKSLQTLVYKLVPTVYQNEARRRTDFYCQARASSSCSEDSVLTDSAAETPEHSLFCHIDGNPIDFFSPEDSISLSLEYYTEECESSDAMTTPGPSTEAPTATDKGTSGVTGDDSGHDSAGSDTGVTSTLQPHRRYLQCPAAVNIRHLSKFIRMKYGLSHEFKVDIIYEEEVLPKYFTLMDVAYSFKWRRANPMRFMYRILECPKRMLKIENSKPESDIKNEVHRTSDVLSGLDKFNSSNLDTMSTPQQTDLTKNEHDMSLGNVQSEPSDKTKVSNESDDKNDAVDDMEEFAKKRDLEWANIMRQNSSPQEEEEETLVVPPVQEDEEDDDVPIVQPKKRKKSKHSKHFESKRRKLHAEIQNQKNDILKLKVRLTPSIHKVHKHSKHYNYEDKTSVNNELSAKERLLQMRQVRHKPVQMNIDTTQTKDVDKIKISEQKSDIDKTLNSKTKSDLGNGSKKVRFDISKDKKVIVNEEKDNLKNPQASTTPSAPQFTYSKQTNNKIVNSVQNRVPNLVAPNSFTVSKVLTGEKRKSDTLEEYQDPKVPSLEIMLINPSSNSNGNTQHARPTGSLIPNKNFMSSMSSPNTQNKPPTVTQNKPAIVLNRNANGKEQNRTVPPNRMNLNNQASAAKQLQTSKPTPPIATQARNSSVVSSAASVNQNRNSPTGVTLQVKNRTSVANTLPQPVSQVRATGVTTQLARVNSVGNMIQQNRMSPLNRTPNSSPNQVDANNMNTQKKLLNQKTVPNNTKVTRPPPATIPLSKIKKAATLAEIGLRPVVHHPKQKLDHFGALDLSGKSTRNDVEESADNKKSDQVNKSNGLSTNLENGNKTVNNVSNQKPDSVQKLVPNSQIRNQNFSNLHILSESAVQLRDMMSSTQNSPNGNESENKEVNKSNLNETAKSQLTTFRKTIPNNGLKLQLNKITQNQSSLINKSSNTINRVPTPITPTPNKIDTTNDTKIITNTVNSKPDTNKTIAQIKPQEVKISQNNVPKSQSPLLNDTSKPRTNFPLVPKSLPPPFSSITNSFMMKANNSTNTTSSTNSVSNISYNNATKLNNNMPTSIANINNNLTKVTNRVSPSNSPGIGQAVNRTNGNNGTGIKASNTSNNNITSNTNTVANINQHNINFPTLKIPVLQHSRNLQAQMKSLQKMPKLQEISKTPQFRATPNQGVRSIPNPSALLQRHNVQNKQIQNGTTPTSTTPVSTSPTAPTTTVSLNEQVVKKCEEAEVKV